MKDNIILIGMPGSGKSSIGVLLAKAIGYDFIDLDIIISKREGDTLQNIINSKGVREFLKIEERAAMSISPSRTVIATGGSAVLGKSGMEHLKSLGVTVFLDVRFGVVKRRIKNLNTRGIAKEESESLYDVYKSRLPLYRKYADLTIECSFKKPRQIVDILAEKLNRA